MPGATAPNKALIAVLFALSHGTLGMVLWFATAFAIMTTITDKAALVLIGYTQIFLIPAVGVLGLILGTALALIERGTLGKRWRLGVGVLWFVAIVVNGGLALVFG